MSVLHTHVDRYIELRRALGFSMREHSVHLHAFVRFLEAQGAESIRVEAALQFAREASTPGVAHGQLGIIRGFARHMRAFDSRTEVPPERLTHYQLRRSRPHLFSARELKVFLDEVCTYGADEFVSKTYYVIFGLMAATGMRTGEVVGIECRDINLDEALLFVRVAKRGRQRWVPIHKTTVEVLRRYFALRQKVVAHPKAPQLFLRKDGNALHRSTIATVFRAVVERGKALPASLPAGVERPRPTSLRHRFISFAMARWVAAKVDVNQSIAALSTYVGHKDPSDTYWYLHNTPQLINAARIKLQRYWNPNYELKKQL